jgi:hypothetical protein
MATEGGPVDEHFLIVSATNMGPGQVTLTGIHLRPPWACIKKIFKRAKWGYLLADYRNPLSAKMPCVVDVGERKNFFLVYNRDCFLKEKKKYERIGILDSFGRIHFASRKDYERAQEEFEEETWEWLGGKTA